MPCTQNDLPIVATPEFVDSANIGGKTGLPLLSAVLDGTSPSLMVSDNPETVRAASPTQAVLARQICLGGLNQSNRLFFWHVNQMGGDRVLGVTLQNRSPAPVQVLSVRREADVVERDNKYLAAGQCIAKSVLGDTLRDIPPPGEDGTIPSGKTALLEQFRWPRRMMLGGQYEILTQSTSDDHELDYVLRVVYGPSGFDLRKMQNDPLPPDGPHARGNWAGSEIETVLQYTIDATNPPAIAHYRLCNGKTDSLDFLLRDTNGLEPVTVYKSLPNRANFGVIYRVRLVVQNAAPAAHTVTVYLNGRGGVLAGAAQMGDMVLGIPPLSGAGLSVRLGTLACGSGGLTEGAISFMVAGASNTPVALVVVPEA